MRGPRRSGTPVRGFFGLNGGFNPTGLITFTLYGAADCADPVAGQPQGVSGDGGYISAPFTPQFAGGYYWVATYSGDSNNLAVSSDCNAEPVDITKVFTAITTSAQPQEALAGTPLVDVATLTEGLNPTGEIVFRLYNGPDCHGSIVSISGVAVSGDGSYTSDRVNLPETETGIFYWVATYSGDSTNQEFSSACNADPVEVDSP